VLARNTADREQISRCAYQPSCKPKQMRGCFVDRHSRAPAISTQRVRRVRDGAAPPAMPLPQSWRRSVSSPGPHLRGDGAHAARATAGCIWSSRNHSRSRDEGAKQQFEGESLVRFHGRRESIDPRFTQVRKKIAKSNGYA